jgi:hypothetical protein
MSNLRVGGMAVPFLGAMIKYPKHLLKQALKKRDAHFNMLQFSVKQEGVF